MSAELDRLVINPVGSGFWKAVPAKTIPAIEFAARNESLTEEDLCRLTPLRRFPATTSDGRS
jgi:hypothetical protein